MSESISPAGLRRVLGPTTVVCVSLGVAIGSGIFAAPGDVAPYLHSPVAILGAWLLGGLVTFAQSLIMAELATRFPHAGGEYQFLKEAYGRFAAFFFGWSFTIFVTGAGVGTIAAGLGRFAAELLDRHETWASSALGCLAIVLVTAANLLGLRTGAVLQNVLSIVKVAALVAIAAVVIFASRRVTPMSDANATATTPSEFFLGFVGVFWSYAGATDAGKLAEEVRDVRSALPRALLGACVLLTAIYLAFNYALLCGVSPGTMVGSSSVPALALERHGVDGAARWILIASILVCLGSVSSTMLSNVRVTYAMARDGLAPRRLAGMSSAQAPIEALLVVAAIACVFVLNRSFGEIVQIYFLASTVLFGMGYVSLIVFRLRDTRSASRGHAHDTAMTGIYRAPAGITLAVLLVAFECVIAWTIIQFQWQHGRRDSLYTLGVLGLIAAAYPVWNATHIRRSTYTGA